MKQSNTLHCRLGKKQFKNFHRGRGETVRPYQIVAHDRGYNTTSRGRGEVGIKSISNDSTKTIKKRKFMLAKDANEYFFKKGVNMTPIVKHKAKKVRHSRM